MADLLTRAYQAGDAPALAGLLNLLDVHAGGHGGYTGPEVEVTIATAVRDVALDTSMLFTPDGNLVAAAMILSPPVGGYRADLVGGVDPKWRGQALGRELLAGQLERVAAIHRATAPETAWQAHSSAMAGDEDALRLYRRFDMKPLRYWFEMAAATAEPVAVPSPDGLRVVTYSPDAEDALYRAHVEAFQDHWGYQRRTPEQWLPMTVRFEHFRPDLSFLAFDGEDLAGYALSYREEDPARLYVGQVGTRRPWRRRGVAAGLLGRLIGAAAAAGFATVSLGVDADSPTGAVGVYERVGFSVASRGVTYSRDLPASK